MVDKSGTASNSVALRGATEIGVMIINSIDTRMTDFCGFDLHGGE